MGRLFWKIFFAFWLALLAAAIGTGVAVSLRRHAQESAERDIAVGPLSRAATDMAASTLRFGGVGALRDWMLEASRGRPVALFAVDAAGRDLLGRAVPEGALEEARALTAQRPEARGARLAAGPRGERYLLFVAAGTDPARRPHRAAFRQAGAPWLPILMGAIASIVASALLAWYLTRPIRSLRWAFDAAARGRLDTRVSPRIGARRDEIADLGRYFDRMAEQLQALVDSQRRLLHDVSHELRSPLARLQAAVGLLRQDPARLEASLDRIERECERLDAMVGEVLTLARLESGSLGSDEQSFDLGELVAQVAADAQFEAQARQRRVALSELAAAHTRGRRELLRRAIENIVRNAVKYSPEGGEVDIAMRVEGEPRAAQIRVRDHGPGIPETELERVFEPFFRSAGAQGHGFGLGLAIAQRAIAAHGGTIRASNASDGGLEVEIRLPLG